MRLDRLRARHAQRAGGLLPRRGWRVDLSFRASDDSVLMSGSDTTNRVTRPKVDFENGLVRPGFHQDLGGTARFVQLDLGYGLSGRTTLLASAPVVTRRSYDVGHPPALTESYETWGLGDTVVYAIPGLVTSLPAKLSVYLFLPVPVYRYANETQVAPRLSLVVGMARSF